MKTHQILWTFKYNELLYLGMELIIQKNYEIDV